MVLPILKLGDPTLRKIAIEVPVEEISSPSIQSLIDDLIETKRAANAIGIAAPQVGSLKRIFLVEVLSDTPSYRPRYPLTIVINPKITFLSEDYFEFYEGCLSIPDLRGAVPRCLDIRVEGFDRNANLIDLKVRGVSAGIFQHELDHLDGVLFLDKVENSKTLCTWEEYRKHSEASFRAQVKEVIFKYGC